MPNKPTYGILIPTPIRPNDLDDNYPSAYAIDIQGGHHMYETLAERNAIKEGRREWGMLCTVYKDTTNNGTYQLVYNASDDVITNNNNWVLFSGAGGSTGEWLSSVVSQIDSPPGVTPSDGARYIIATPSFGIFITQSNRIAVWSSNAGGGSGDWSYITPMDGFTVRRDDELNVLYKYTGTWSLNNPWKKEYLNQVRYIQPTSTNGTTYSFTSSTNLVPLDLYSYSVYFANFNMTNSGPSEIQIDGLGYFPIKKSSGNNLLSLASGDLVPNIQYQISWNQNEFLLAGFGGGGSAGVIGPAEDGTYSDGLYTDFNPSTPIGTPIDRFNEILKALVPPPAPDLTSWSIGGPTFVTDGKLSFDNSTPGGYFSPPGFPKGSTYTVTSTRLGINSGVAQTNAGTTNYYQDITGQLNYLVPATTAYNQYAFGNGTTGSLVLMLNGQTISNVNLGSTLSSINTSGGSDGGFILSAATNSKFPSGAYFDLFWYRTGTYLIKKTSANIRKGFNYLELSHILPSNTLTVASYSWVSDFSAASTQFQNQLITNISVDPINGVKVLSGIKYFKQVTLEYRLDYLNHVSDTYKSGTPISATTADVNLTVNNPITLTPTLLGAGVTKIMSAGNPISIPTPGSPTTLLSYTWSFSLNQNVRRLNESITFLSVVNRTVQGTDTSTGLIKGGWLIDNYNAEQTTDSEEVFEIETKRLSNGPSKYSVGFTDDINSFGSFNSNDSLLSNNQLQYCNGLLIYPKYNFTSFGDSQTNPNRSNPNADYSQASVTPYGHGTYSGSPLTKNRTWTRLFRVNTLNTYAKVNIYLELSSTNFVSVTTELKNTNPTNCWIEVKLPTDTSRPIPGGLVDGGVTGWMDLTQKFDPGYWGNGKGAYTGNFLQSGGVANVVAEFGNRNTYYSNGYVLLRITASPFWTGSISKVLVFGTT